MWQVQNTLYITTPEAYLRLEGETVCVMVEQEKRLQIPLHHLGAIVCFGSVMLSPALLGRCMEEGHTVVWLERSGRFQARVEGPVSGNILLRQAQYRAADDPTKTIELARAFLAGKLRNSRNVLLRGARDGQNDVERSILMQNARLVAGHLRKLPHAPDLDSLRGEEDNAARVYFQSMRYLIRQPIRSDFAFDARNRRPPTDSMNSILSFLYAVLLHDCRSALEAVGLDPQLGFLHAVRPGRAALALDLLEEFRSVIADRLALTLVNRGQIQAGHFDKRDGGAVLLNDEGRKAVIAAYQERKQETLTHPVLDQEVPIGLLPHVQARLLARYLRGDASAYVPYLHR
ncbi:CRISPR-associated Cas1 family protein [mine drainage metagenome]|uniref:CRISPR-associated Cas1 family protein n=1 Tax=mine drainage metagenome TaxID=410659 RepID=T0ZTT8_9ZZZZ